MEAKELCKECVFFIEKNLMKRITLDDIVNAVYFSKSYVQHIFKKEMGVSIVQYLCSRKMEKAKELLDSGKTPSVLAKELGYKDYREFSGKFKYYYGISPVRYQKIK